jgi:mRNA-degrading endonuclease toxin of MazEF toxin-antitoxin module
VRTPPAAAVGAAPAGHGLSWAPRNLAQPTGGVGRGEPARPWLEGGETDGGRVADPRRGEVWGWHPAGDTESFVLVVSCESWNRRHVSSVLAVPLEDGHTQDSGSFAPLIDAEGSPMTVYADEIIGVQREDLTSLAFVLAPEALDDVDAALDRALSPERPPPGGQRPPTHPYPGQIRFAELHIPGEGPKPVVVVSSEAYAAELEYALVMVCRKTSNPGNVHDFDVPLVSQVGKVVCSDLRTVRTDDLLERTTNPYVVTATERQQILTKARAMVGLSGETGASGPGSGTMKTPG